MPRLLTILTFICFANFAQAQDASFWKKNGNDLLAIKQYQPALEAFQQAEKLDNTDAETRTNIGICHYHLHQPAEAEAQLLAAFEAKGTPPPINFIYLAKLHQARLEFEEAVGFYKQFLKKTTLTHPWRAAVRDEIRRCATGLQVRRLPALAAVLPLADLNSAADEFKPLPSPSGQERLYFSAAGRSKTGSDIFYTKLMAGDWAIPKPLDRFVNSADHETALGFNESGASLYFFRGKTLENGQILVDSFREDPVQGTLFFEEFVGPMRPDEGDCAPFFFNDSILLFASRRAGGFGGLDLYVSTCHGSDWKAAENLGTVINTAYDDTSPFLARDGRTLYFSSNDPSRSMGGLDVLGTSWLDWSLRWSQPANLGPPVNSAADDEHFVLANAGDRAFFSSDRITGEGGRDLFVALFEQPREEQLGESWPVAFHLVAPDLNRGKTDRPSEAAVQPPDGFFDEITSFELPVMTLPTPGGTPGERTVNQFALLAQLLKKFPKLNITLALHSTKGDEPMAAFLFASETATDLLRQEGVGLGRVTLLFAGSGFPIAASASALNRRAEIFVENPTLLPFELYRPPLPDTMQKALFFQKTLTSLAYRVEANPNGASELSKLFELYPDGLVEQRPPNGTDRLGFTPGIYLTQASAEAWRQSLVSDGYKDAKITAYLRGRELSREEAAKYLEDFPDLQNFIEN